MKSKNYNDIVIKLWYIITELARGEKDCRHRLIDVFSRTEKIYPIEFPDELQKDWIKIHLKLTSGPKDDLYNIYHSTLIKKRNSTCSQIIDDIIQLYIKVRNHFD